MDGEGYDGMLVVDKMVREMMVREMMVEGIGLYGSVFSVFRTLRCLFGDLLSD